MDAPLANGADKPQDETLTLSSGVRVRLRQPTGSNYILAMELAEGSATLVPTFEALMCVAAIGEEPQAVPRTRAQIDALANRVGRAGVDDLAGWFQQKQYPEIMQAVATLGANAPSEALAAEAVKLRQARLKNSPGTQ